MTARIGWAPVRIDTGSGEQWLRLTAYEDGWVEQPTFGRPTSALGDTARKVLVRLALVVILGSAAWGFIALFAAAGAAIATIARYAAGAPLLVLGGWWLLRRRRRTRKRQPWNGTPEDLRRVRAAGILPRRIPGSPWRRATTALDASARTTNLVLIPAADVASVHTLAQPDGDQVVQVLLHSGAGRIYRSRDDSALNLLARFGVPAIS